MPSDEGVSTAEGMPTVSHGCSGCYSGTGVVPERPCQHVRATGLWLLAGPLLLRDLNDHPDNLPPSVVSSQAVNGSVMEPIGQLPVTFSLGSRSYSDNVYVYPGVRGVLLYLEQDSLMILHLSLTCTIIISTKSYQDHALVLQDSDYNKQ